MSTNCTDVQLKGGSLFDGIGGFPLAGTRFGIDFVWASEIESFPIEVTKRHYPNMKHLGDITKIKGNEIEPVDVITFGSPCQDLSVAGKRAGLDGQRSGLFMEAVRIIREMREATNGKYPRFAVWENVPGAFSSSKGADFRAVLEEIAESEIPMPASGKWATAGMVRSNGIEIAWRVLDAQYWGVPQRRKRIFLVADFTGQRAGEILFVEEGLRGDFAESRSTRESIVRSLAECAGSNRITYSNAGYSNCQQEDIAATQRACIAKQSDVDLVLEPTICFEPGAASRLGGYTNIELCSTLRADMGDNQPCVLFEPRSHDGVPRIHDNVCPTLNTAQGGQRQPCNDTRLPNEAVEPIPINDKATRYKGGGDTRNNDGAGNVLGVGNPGDPSPTLTAGDRHAVGYTAKQFAGYQEGIGTLKASGGDLGGGSETLVKQGYKVRRLTPTECERLQGLPDNYTAGGSDTARYKAIGNGMAQPCVDFVISGIATVLRGE